MDLKHKYTIYMYAFLTHTVRLSSSSKIFSV